jgi:hypothetical protein
MPAAAANLKVRFVRATLLAAEDNQGREFIDPGHVRSLPREQAEQLIADQLAEKA